MLYIFIYIHIYMYIYITNIYMYILYIYKSEKNGVIFLEWSTGAYIFVCLFVHHTTSILVKLSTWCSEHSGDTSCSLLVDPSHTDESWEGRNTCLWIYALNSFIEHSGED